MSEVSLEDQLAAAQQLLARIARVVRAGTWRDRAGLSVAAHPIWDDVREFLLTAEMRALMEKREEGNT